MPSNIVQQIDRLVSSQLNLGTGDVLPGTSVASGTGAPWYGGQVGARVVLDSQSIRFKSSVGTLYGGIYQYVFMTYTTTQPAIGQLVFWDNSVGESIYQVNGDAKPSTAVPSLVAGVVLQTTVTKGTYAWMCIGGRCSVLPDSTITATTAGSPISAKVSATVPSTVDNGAAVGIATLPSIIGISEATVAASTVVIAQLNPLMRHF